MEKEETYNQEGSEDDEEEDADFEEGGSEPDF